MNKIQDYTFALNVLGELVNIKDASYGETYFCPVCGNLMVPHKGNRKKWHFQHKINCICNSETYLHKIAKKRIRNLLLQSTEFYLEYSTNAVCNINCPFGNYPKCSRKSSNRINLKDFYNECMEEVEYNTFRPDLILFSSEFPKRKPILIEIYVTHKCSTEKIKLGERIIEIKLEKMENLEALLNIKCFSGLMPNVTMYNFNLKEKEFKPQETNFVASLYYWIIRKGSIIDVGKCYCWEGGGLYEIYSTRNDNIFISDVNIEEDLFPFLCARHKVYLNGHDKFRATNEQLRRMFKIKNFRKIQ